MDEHKMERELEALARDYVAKGGNLKAWLALCAEVAEEAAPSERSESDHARPTESPEARGKRAMEGAVALARKLPKKE